MTSNGSKPREKINSRYGKKIMKSKMNRSKILRTLFSSQWSVLLTGFLINFEILSTVYCSNVRFTMNSSINTSPIHFSLFWNNSLWCYSKGMHLINFNQTNVYLWHMWREKPYASLYNRSIVVKFSVRCPVSKAFSSKRKPELYYI